MANAGPGTDGSQFFLTFAPYPSLDGGYTIWGEVTEGLQTLKALEAKADPNASNGAMATPIKINKTWITAVPKPKADKPADEKPKDGEKKGGDKK
jgi:cyclophilin family peptidyl-prolyl cis-trans isomerase